MKTWIYQILSVVLLIGSTTVFSAEADCTDGFASMYPCLKTRLLSKVNLKQALSPQARGANDIWGWTDSETGKEYALMGMTNSTAFVDISDPANPVVIGSLATKTFESTWRDIKVYKDTAYIVSEAYNHGLQVFDLKKLRSIKKSQMPFAFKEDVHYANFGNAHNIAINEETGFAYAVGTSTCDGGLHIIDIRSPLQPKFSTCIDRSIFDLPREDGETYTHDVQCVIYRGPDQRYQGREICVASNEDTLNIVDVTDKNKPVQIGVSTYQGVRYTHQGWLSEDQSLFFLGDELDESRDRIPTKTLVWDVSDLTNPTHSYSYTHNTKAIDHNMYTKGNFLYQANYDAGLRVLDVSKAKEGTITTAGYFDVLPQSNSATFAGVWSVYPYFKSGNIVLSDMRGILFVVKFEE